MSDNQIWYRYNPDKALTDAEREVMAKGYPYVSTTELAAGGLLNEHRHHSNNTHFVIKGSIIIGKSHDSIMRFRPVAVLPYNYVNLPRCVDYMGTAGEKGCTFVEGHKVLSPATADRFFERKTIVKLTAGESMEGAFPAVEHE
ncbi:hypothetical protein LTR91_018894 [Friedmanniomyces endolithicus]|uniref:Uncharacterized protein n=1 Tax=Friedmanniomyces endolithicus TaxID=329885 RepID=A0A4U0V7Y6_9PEZI|nr:hypothetical protein LTS09_009660 [Friedmanniomyces endolithicus]KAK0344284.1 hypothetical protein LTR94_015145 [Friedmanniomyces endolithicus]KAK0777551.1 hypothetical protein LTR59_013833 [Friedmanniomyces endolithicus]KAK0783448.1 hypothetical protein LTR38_012997 [Friedmanniomyces endolithicus]KAK0788152.1 hypothetical protein LTR75_012659 [Friedmanniomyces endolithicus]